MPLLVKELQSPDKNHFVLGLRVARELPGPEATAAVAAELARAAPQRQSLLILALADRGDASVVPQIVKAAKNSPEQVRIQALRALKKIDESVTAPVLLDAALEDNPAISQAALAVIDGLQGTAIDGLIAERLPRASGPARMILMELAGRRHIAAATAILWKAADDADPAVRTTALTALGGTIQVAELPQLIAKLRAAQTATMRPPLPRPCSRLRSGCPIGRAAPRSWPPRWRRLRRSSSASCWRSSGPWAARRRWPPWPTPPEAER